MKFLFSFFKKTKPKSVGNKFRSIFLNKFIINCFIFSGVWKSETDHRRNPYKALFNLLLLTSSFFSVFYMFILAYNDIDMNTEILLHFVEIFFSTCAQLMFIVKKQQISRLAESLNTRFDQLEFPEEIKEECLKILRKESKTFKRVIGLAFSAIASIYVSIILDSKILYGVEGRKLLYPTWLPFLTDADHPWFYWLAVVFQLTIYVELLCIDLATAGLWYGTINTAAALLDILGLLFQNLNENIGDVPLGNDYKLKEKYTMKIKMCVSLHNYVKGLIRDLNQSIGVIFLVLVLTSQVAICFCGFLVIQAITSKDSTKLLKFFIGIGVFTLMLFVYCVSGEKLKNKSEEFYQRLFQCKWYESPKQNQQDFYICQTISKRALTIVSVQTVPANLHTFIVSIRTVFSYLNFLLALEEKN